MPDGGGVEVPLQHQRPQQINGLCSAEDLGNAELSGDSAVPDHDVVQSPLSQAPLQEGQDVAEPALQALRAPGGGFFAEQQVQQRRLQVVVCERALSAQTRLLPVKESDGLEAVYVTGVLRQALGQQS